MATVKIVQLRAEKPYATLYVYSDGKTTLQHNLSDRDLGKHPKLHAYDSAGVRLRLSLGSDDDRGTYVSLAAPAGTEPPITFYLSDVPDPKGQAQLVVEPAGGGSRGNEPAATAEHGFVFSLRRITPSI